MPGKGSKNCCCDGCNEKPLDRSLPLAALQVWQQYCCTCVPSQICVTVDYAPTSESNTVTFDRDCTAVVGDPILYSGEVYSNGALIDIQIIFEVDDGKCYICLRSTSLSVAGTVPADCVEITEAIIASGFCASFLISGLPVSWTVGDYTISLFRANNTAIENRQCQPDDNPIRNLCCGCGCISECACIQVFGDGITASAEYVCLGGTTSWVTADGVEVALVANETTGNCELQLMSTGSTTVVSIPANVAIDSVSNPCPSPSALWSMFTSPGGKAWFVKWNAAQCGGCDRVEAACCEGYAPRILTATVTSGDCACASATISLVYSELSNSWTGTLSTGFCSHGITLELLCSGSSWELIPTMGPCIISSATASSNCDPLSLSFSLTSTGGIGCCGPADMGGTYHYTVTVTE